MFKINTSAGVEAPAALQPSDAEVHVFGLTKSFGRTDVLNGVNLDVRRGEAVALVGSNGAGKSTLLRCMLRLIEPTDGRVELCGDEMTALNRSGLRKLRAQIGFVFQKHNLVPRLTALTNVLHGAQSRKRGPRVWWAHAGNGRANVRRPCVVSSWSVFPMLRSSVWTSFPVGSRSGWPLPGH